ncbi:MAG: matrixin family metalloprotease [Minisyncoccota bacterium]
MKRLLKIFLILVVIGAGVFIIPKVFFVKPCTRPITYNLGTFDEQFGISKTYFLSALKEAEAIWEKPLGKDLFAYAPEDGRLKVNLIYDYRQQATSKLADLGIIVKDNKASYDSLETKYLSLKTQYEEAKRAYEAQFESLNQKNKAYEQQVKYWNAHGGAPKKEYEQLVAERSVLENEASQLQTAQVRLNSMVDELNALVVVLNKLAKTLNLAVDQYNTIGESRGESFTEGLYQSSAAGQEIDIYEFSSRDKLVRVLAHELGHALGLDHISDPQAIMYTFNSGENMELTQADLVELKTLCGV